MRSFLGLDCGRGLPADLRTAESILRAAVEAGVRMIDVGNGCQPGIKELLRHKWDLPGDLQFITRLDRRDDRPVKTAVDEIRIALDLDFIDYCLLTTYSAADLRSLCDLAAAGVIGRTGVYDPGHSFLDAWRAGTGGAVSLQSGLLNYDGLSPYTRTAQMRPVFVRWDLRMPKAAAARLSSVRDAAHAAGLSLPLLGLCIPLYTPGVTAVLISTRAPGDAGKILRDALSLNPDSELMREFLDSGIMKGPRA